ncbi:MAG: sugar isomerase domain-containing protein [Opitutaceae bacterium]|nr:sugar isomerase domain-containing protein [Opitutaceae bacterium]
MSTSSSAPTSPLEFPDRLETVRAALRAQEPALRTVATLFADAIATGGLVHVYANGHSRLAVEELCIRMGALTGFHPILQVGLTSFTDVVGPNGIRLNQALEKVEGLGEQLLDEFDIAPGEPLLAVSATGQTAVAVDIALAWRRRYPAHPLVLLCSREQARQGAPKHTSGKTFWHIAQEGGSAVHLLDNAMPVGDTSVTVAGRTDTYAICPVSSIGALSIVQCLNELTLRELDARGVRHHVLRNMHLKDTRDTYNAWIRDQRARYARALHNPAVPASSRRT